MFSQASVILSTGGEGFMRGEGGCACQAGCMPGAMHGRGACMAGETATAADGTHPTGMHSCCVNLNAICAEWINIYVT